MADSPGACRKPGGPPSWRSSPHELSSPLEPRSTAYSRELCIDCWPGAAPRAWTPVPRSRRPKRNSRATNHRGPRPDHRASTAADQGRSPRPAPSPSPWHLTKRRPPDSVDLHDPVDPARRRSDRARTRQLRRSGHRRLEVHHNPTSGGDPTSRSRQPGRAAPTPSRSRLDDLARTCRLHAHVRVTGDLVPASSSTRPTPTACQPQHSPTTAVSTPPASAAGRTPSSTSSRP